MSRLSDTDRSGWPGMLTAQDRRSVIGVGSPPGGHRVGTRRVEGWSWMGWAGVGWGALAPLPTKPQPAYRGPALLTLSETVVTGLTKYSAWTVTAVPAVLSFGSGEADATRGRVGGVHDSDSPPCVHAPLLRSRGIKWRDHMMWHLDDSLLCGRDGQFWRFWGNSIHKDRLEHCKTPRWRCWFSGSQPARWRWKFAGLNNTSFLSWWFLASTLCWHDICCGSVFVCVSDTSRCSVKMARNMIMHTVPHDSRETVVFC